jgi:hypothetical protein
MYGDGWWWSPAGCAWTGWTWRTTGARQSPPNHPEAPGRTPDPADQMMLHDEVRQALSVLVDRLSPAERTSFILHDIFGSPFDAVAALVGQTPAFDVTQIDLVSLGGLVPPDRKAELKAQIDAINPRVIVIDSLAGIPGLIAGQVQEAFTAGLKDPAQTPSYMPADRSIRLTLADPAAVKVTVWWRVSLIPPDPKSDTLVLLDARLPSGEHAISVPVHIPPQAATPRGPRPAAWFASVQAGPAIYNFGIPAGQ